jgi:hypothetical protein
MVIIFGCSTTDYALDPAARKRPLPVPSWLRLSAAG